MNDLPSDADMINWIEKTGFTVLPPANRNPNGGIPLWAVIVPSLGFKIAHGETWRAAVEAGIEADRTGITT